MISRAVILLAFLVIASGQTSTKNIILPDNGIDDQRPNIIYIEVDDLTYKYIGAFGKEFAKTLNITPNIDKIAAQGVLFQNAMAQGTMCSPSRNSTITSRYPHNIGNYKNGDSREMPDDTWTFSAALQRAGYYTKYLGKSHLKPYLGDAATKSERMEVEFGFDHVWQSSGRAVIFKKAQQPYTPGADEYLDFLYNHNPEYIQTLVDDNNQTTSLPDSIYLDGYFTYRTEKWLQSYPEDKPFFLYLDYSAPHGPFDQPAEFQDLYNPDDMPGAVVDDDMSDLPDEFIHKAGTLTGDAVKPWQADYSSMVTYLDHQVGLVLTALEENNFIENTMIVFFSDHGLSCGDHGLKNKQNLYKEVLNACLIISYPALFNSGVSVDNVVELTDLSPTVLEIANASQSDKDMSWGYSLLPLLEGRDGFQREAAFAEHDSVVAMVRTDYKYVWHRTQPVLFDLQNDPDELVNVIDQFPDVAAEMKAAVEFWKMETGDLLVTDIDLHDLNIVRSREEDTIEVQINSDGILTVFLYKINGEKVHSYYNGEVTSGQTINIPLALSGDIAPGIYKMEIILGDTKKLITLHNS